MIVIRSSFSSYILLPLMLVATLGVYLHCTGAAALSVNHGAINTTTSHSGANSHNPSGHSSSETGCQSIQTFVRCTTAVSAYELMSLLTRRVDWPEAANVLALAPVSSAPLPMSEFTRNHSLRYLGDFWVYLTDPILAPPSYLLT